MPHLRSSWRSRFRTVLVWIVRSLQPLLPLKEARAVEAVVRRLQRPAPRRGVRQRPATRPAQRPGRPTSAGRPQAVPTSPRARRAGSVPTAGTAQAPGRARPRAASKAQATVPRTSGSRRRVPQQR